jgi:Tfp pilus assembly protein PilO
MEQIRRYRTPLLTAVGALAVVIVVYMAWIAPEGSKLSSLHAQQTQLQAQESSLQTELTVLRGEKEHQAANCQELTQDLTEIPGSPTVDAFYHQISSLAVAAGDPNTPTISVTQASGEVGGTNQVSVDLTLNGNYGQMTGFLKGLDGFPRLFTISSVTVNGGPVAIGGSTPAAGTAGYTLSLQGDVYYSTGQNNVCSDATTTAAS